MFYAFPFEARSCSSIGPINIASAMNWHTYCEHSFLKENDGMDIF